MTIIYGFFTDDSENREQSALSTLGREIGADSAAHAVLDAPGFGLRLCRQDGGTTIAVRGTTRDDVDVAIVGRPLDHEKLAQSIPHLEWRDVRQRLAKLDGYWVAFGLDRKGHALELLCDHLGVAWLYWARVPGGLAFSSDFGALARSLPKRPRLDDNACLLMLTLTYPLGDVTCFEDIRLVSPGSVLKYSRGEATHERLTSPVYEDRYAGASRKQKYEALDAIFEASYRSWSLPGASPPWAVALSSGNDSRYALGLLLRHQERPACATFGLPGSDDVRGAAAVCRREGLQHTFFSTNRRTSWESWRGAVQRLGVVAGFQYGAGWAHDWRHTLRGLGGQAVLGFLGDALSGRHLVERSGGDWIADWEAWSLDLREDGAWSGSDLLRSEVRNSIRDSIRGALTEECRDVQFAFEHQKALNFDLFSRQRRITASQIDFLTDEVAVAPLFYTKDMIDFWSSLAYADLKGQKLYLEYARERFPSLFPPPRPPSLYQRARGTLVNLAISLHPDLKRHLAPPEIDTRALVGQHLDLLRALIRDYGEALDHIVDIAALNSWLDRFHTREGLRAPRLQRFWNLLILVESGFAGRGR